MSEAQVPSGPVLIYMKIVDSRNLAVLYDTGDDDPIQSDLVTARGFLRGHGKDVSINSSGYAADVSSNVSSSISLESTHLLFQNLHNAISNNNNRWSGIGSTISSIPCIPGETPRVNRPTFGSSGGEGSGLNMLSPLKNRQGDRREPLLTSSKIDESFVTQEDEENMGSRDNILALASTQIGTDGEVSESEVIPDPVDNPNGVSNGQEQDVNMEVDETVDKATTNDDDEEQELVTPRGRGVKRCKNDTSTSDESFKRYAPIPKRLHKMDDVFDTSSNGSEPIERKGSSREMNRGTKSPPTNAETSMDEMGSSDGHIIESPVAKQVLDGADLASLSDSSTLWGSIALGELVFARWRDKNYYSGVIKEKGLSDNAWNIHFDDNMDGVASEPHILPIKILGVGVRVIFSLDNVYRSSSATITGQKFGDEHEQIQYAIQCDDVPTITILCQRKQLSLTESEARDLRSNYHSTTPRTADFSIDNILPRGPRRRGAGSLSRSALDSSLGNDSALSGAGSPTPKKPTAGTPTPKKPTAGTPTPKRLIVTSKLASATKVSNSPLANSLFDTSADTGCYIGTPSLTNTPKTLPGPSSAHRSTPIGGFKDSPMKRKSRGKGLFDGFDQENSAHFLPIAEHTTDAIRDSDNLNSEEDISTTREEKTDSDDDL